MIRPFTRASLLLFAVGLLAATGCTSSPGDPLGELVRRLEGSPVYSVILEDMRERGNFAKSYEHRYRAVWADQVEAGGDLTFQDRLGSWEQVDRRTYERYEPMLGMAIRSKKEGEVEETPQPPGYAYVGDERYGQWRNRNDGTSFWEFYGKYALFNHLFGHGQRPVRRSDWDLYRKERSARRPYFGPKGEFGTRGEFTRTTQPTFFERQQTRRAAGRQQFSEKVNRRIQRSRMSSTRSRSGSRGGK
ncbi:MAG: hypothetical protein AAGN66_00395 [Acidobacteriota bacterium]